MFLNFFFNRISFLAVATDIMVATGRNSFSFLDSVETIRMTEAKDEVTVETCVKSVPAYPLRVLWAVGSTFINGEPLICGGGHPKTERCYQLNTNEWQEAPQLPSARFNLKMATTDQTTFISGGWVGSALNEFHQLNGEEWQPLSPLPIEVSSHCLVALSETHLVNIGGYIDGSDVSK